MEIDANVYNLINILLQVVLWSLIISAPAIILTLEMYAYERYKKWKDMSEKELERIIIGKTTNKESLENEIKELKEDKRRLALDVELLEIRLDALTPEEPEESEVIETPEDPEEQILEKEKMDLNSLNIKQLHELARKHKLKWYSRMKKDELVNALDPLVQ